MNETWAPTDLFPIYSTAKIKSCHLNIMQSRVNLHTHRQRCIQLLEGRNVQTHTCDSLRPEEWNLNHWKKLCQDLQNEPTFKNSFRDSNVCILCKTPHNKRRHTDSFSGQWQQFHPCGENAAEASISELSGDPNSCCQAGFFARDLWNGRATWISYPPFYVCRCVSLKGRCL